MPLIIDTYNVLHVTGILPPDLAGIETDGLINLLETSRYRDQEVTLVCDGNPAPGSPKGRFGPVNVRYAGPGQTADDLIKKIVDRSSIPRRLTVISSDREILRAARRRRCQIMNSEQFLQHLAFDAQPGHSTDASSKRGQVTLSEDQIRQWMLEFDVDERIIESELPDFDPHTKNDPPLPLAENKDRTSPDEPDSEDSKPDPNILPDDLLREAKGLIDTDQQSNSPDLPPQNPDTMDP